MPASPALPAATAVLPDVGTLPALDTPYPLTAAQVAAYRHDGHVYLPQLCTRAEMAAFRPHLLAAIAGHLAQLKPLGERDAYAQMFVQTMHLWERHAAIARLSLARRLAQVAAQLLQARAVRFYHDQTLIKEPGGSRTPWHQDGLYVPLDRELLTLWMPLVDVPAAMGTLRFASGSQHQGRLLELGVKEEGERLYQALIEQHHWPVVEARDMAAGDATLHSAWTVHGAPPNASDRPREVITLLYYVDGARVTDQGYWQGATKTHLGNRQPGELADDPGNPLVFRAD